MHIHASQEKEGLDKEISPKFSDFLPSLRLIGPKNALEAIFPVNLTASLFGECLLVACLFSLYAGSIAPEVNESHYWTKAKHFWDPGFAPRDLFLSSADAHWFFFSTVGAIANIVPLPVAAWCGRILGWLAVAFGWCVFVRTVTSFRLAAAVSAPLWIASMHWGQLSGEWVVGGCEAKVFAYAFAFIGLSEILKNRWSRAWCWFGLASAFHVLTGGWITLASLICFAIIKWQEWKRKSEHRGNPAKNSSSRIGSEKDQVEATRSQWSGLLAGGCLSLPGLLPALMLNRGVDAATAEKGAMIYVFQRLPHHLSPMRFAGERWLSFSLLVVLSIFFLWGYFRTRAARQQNPPDPNLNSLFLITGIVSSIAALGVLLDAGLTPWAANWSASLLRYYWFRWNDVVWPTLLTVLVLKMVSFSSTGNFQLRRFLAFLLLAIPGPWLIGIRYLEHNRETLSPADQASLVMRTESVSVQKRIREDWLDVCYWIRSNTPSDSLFLTPRFQQTFKWNALRAEVACWKDAPQDSLGLIEWERRMLEIFPRSEEGYGLPMTDQHLMEMRLRYNVDYVVVDRRIQKQPPLLSVVHSNETYYVFEFR